MNAKHIIIIIVIAVFAYLLGRESIYDNGNGINQVRTDLQRVEDDNRKLTSGIEEAKDYNREASDSVDRLNADQSDALRLIDEGESILRAIRQRGAKEAAAQ